MNSARQIAVGVTCGCVDPPNWVGLLKFADNRDLGRGYELSGVHGLETGVEDLVNDRPIPRDMARDDFYQMVHTVGWPRRRYVMVCHACRHRLPMRHDRLNKIAAMLFAPPAEAYLRGSGMSSVDMREVERMLAKA